MNMIGTYNDNSDSDGVDEHSDSVHLGVSSDYVVFDHKSCVNQSKTSLSVDFTTDKCRNIDERTASEDFFGLGDTDSDPELDSDPEGDKSAKNDPNNSAVETTGLSRLTFSKLYYPASVHENKTNTSINSLPSTSGRQMSGIPVPRSKFWAGEDSVIDWSNPDKVWHTGSMNHAGRCSPPKKQKFLPSQQVHTKKDMQNSIDNMRSDFNTKITKSCYFVHHRISPVINSSAKAVNGIARKLLIKLTGHEGAVNRIKWCTPNYSHLLLSASMDKSVKIWNVFSSQNNCVQTLAHHTKAVKDAKWSVNGDHILSCSYDKTICLMDVEKGTCIRRFEEESFVTCVEYHPVNHHLFLTGAANSIRSWDSRTSKKYVRQFKYKDSYGQVNDLAFLPNGKEFFSCNDLVSRDSADRNIMAWDFYNAVVLSNQMYQERYTCCRLLVHPWEAEVMAQSQGGYIALFSTIRPYKLNKYKRYEGHQVVGYNIGFDMSPDGKLIMSGSSNGTVPFYDYRTSRNLGKITLGRNEVCLDVSWHPVLSSTVALGTWSGDVSVWS